VSSPLVLLDDDCLILSLTRLRAPIRYVTVLDIRVTEGIEGILDDRSVMLADVVAEEQIMASVTEEEIPMASVVDTEPIVGTLTATESIIGEMECP